MTAARSRFISTPAWSAPTAIRMGACYQGRASCGDGRSVRSRDGPAFRRGTTKTPRALLPSYTVGMPYKRSPFGVALVLALAAGVGLAAQGAPAGQPPAGQQPA